MSGGPAEWEALPVAPAVEFDAFLAPDIRVGRIVGVEPFPEARKPAWKLTIDLGPLGTRRSSAQITELYEAGALVGRQVLCVVNLKPRRIGPFVSEVLTLGVPDGAGRVVLVTPEREVPLGGRLY